MKDGNLTILYTKETRSFLHSAPCLQSSRAYRATEQQSNRAAEQTAAEQSAGHLTPCSVVT
jgi:hypothetical protein